jgi:hypothetical protein
MKTSLFVGVLFFIGFAVSAQDIKDLSEGVGKLQKDVKTLRSTDQSFKSQIKQAKAEIENQKNVLAETNMAVADLKIKIDTLSGKLDEYQAASLKATKELKASQQLFSAVILIVMALVIAVLLVFILMHRKLHTNENLKLEKIQDDLKVEIQAMEKQVAGKLVSRIELLEEKLQKVKS